MEEFQKYFFQTTFHHHFQARNAKISLIFHFDRGHNGWMCHILDVKIYHLVSTANPALCGWNWAGLALPISWYIYKFPSPLDLKTIYWHYFLPSFLCQKIHDAPFFMSNDIQSRTGVIAIKCSFIEFTCRQHLYLFFFLFFWLPLGNI